MSLPQSYWQELSRGIPEKEWDLAWGARSRWCGDPRGEGCGCALPAFLVSRIFGAGGAARCLGCPSYIQSPCHPESIRLSQCISTLKSHDPLHLLSWRPDSVAYTRLMSGQDGQDVANSCQTPWIARSHTCRVAPMICSGSFGARTAGAADGLMSDSIQETKFREGW